MPSICRTNLSWLHHSLTHFWRDMYDEEIYWKHALHSLPLVASCDEREMVSQQMEHLGKYKPSVGLNYL